MNLWNNKSWSPMLLSEINEPFNSKDYLYEIKFDGIRAICYASPKNVKIMSRNKKDITGLFPELQEIKNIVKKNVIFDGEIIVTENGKPNFSLVQKRIHLKNTSRIKSEAKDNPAQFIAFDILYEDKNLTELPLIERKELLNNYQDNNIFIKSKTFSNGINLFKEIKKLNLEGIVAKNKNSKYYINKRTDDFIKIKNIQREDFIIGGYIDNPKINIITIAVGDYKNNKFYYLGKVIVSKKNKIYSRLLKLPKVKKSFIDKEDDNMIYVKPKVKCTIEYLEKTKNGHLRHANLKEV